MTNYECNWVWGPTLEGTILTAESMYQPAKIGWLWKCIKIMIIMIIFTLPLAKRSSISWYAKFSEKLSFLTYVCTCAYQGVRSVSFSGNFAYILNTYFVGCILTVVDHLKVHFQQDFARTDHIHLMNLSNMLIQIAIDVKRRNYHQMVYLFMTRRQKIKIKNMWINVTFANALIQYTQLHNQ